MERLSASSYHWSCIYSFCCWTSCLLSFVFHLLFLFLFSFFYLDCKCYAKNLSRVSWKRRKEEMPTRERIRFQKTFRMLLTYLCWRSVSVIFFGFICIFIYYFHFLVSSNIKYKRQIILIAFLFSDSLFTNINF